MDIFQNKYTIPLNAYLSMGIKEWVVASTAEFMWAHGTFEVHASSLGKVIPILAAWAY